MSDHGDIRYRRAFRRWWPVTTRRNNRRRWQLAHLRANPGGKSTAVIPPGQFCAGCPYLSHRPDKGEKWSGYCSLLGLGDWMHAGTGHLWDGVKECGRRYDEAEPALRFTLRREQEARWGGAPLRGSRRRGDRLEPMEDGMLSHPWWWDHAEEWERKHSRGDGGTGSERP